MFNIFLNDLFLVLKDTSPHACDFSLDELLMRFEHDSALAVCWFESNYMKLNFNKCHLIIAGNKHESFWADTENDRIWKSNYVKFLGINIDGSLKFDSYAESL